MDIALERRAAEIFSTAAFRSILDDGSSTRISAALADLRSGLGLMSETNGQVIQAAYEMLEQNYRNEYVYKNLIASKLYIGRHRAANATLLHEFRVGGSVADAVFINGTATAFEIKTELDRPQKLKSQIDDYFRAFNQVNLVVHERDLDRFSKPAANWPVGVISVGRRMRLSVRTTAPINNTGLEVRAMFDALRIAEVREVLIENGLTLPDVPNGLRYEAWLEAALSIPTNVFHSSFTRALKRRAPVGRSGVLLDPDLRPLRSILVQLSPNPTQEDRLLKWLVKTGG